VSKNRFAGPAIAIIIVVLFVVWMASGSDDNQAQLNSNPQPAKSLIATVQVVPSESRWVNQSLKINGITEAKRSVTVRSEANGKVVRLLKEQGQIVKKGDVIAELDQQDIPARLKQAKAFVEQTRLEYEGAQKLKGQGLQNEVQLAGALTNYEQAKAQLAGLELQQANTAIRAPFNGQIENLNLELGSFVRQGDAIADIYDYSELKFVGAVSEKDISSLKLGQTATVELINGELAPAKISYIGSVTNAATRTFSVELRLNPVNRNVSGVTSVASIDLERDQGHFISPALLYINEAGVMGLKTLDSSNRVVFNDVHIMHSETEGVWVGGLPDKANIIVVGQGFVNIGDETNPTFNEFDSTIAVGL